MGAERAGGGLFAGAVPAAEGWVRYG